MSGCGNYRSSQVISVSSQRDEKKKEASFLLRNVIRLYFSGSNRQKMYRIWFMQPQELTEFSFLSWISPHKIHKENNCNISWKVLSMLLKGIQDMQILLCNNNENMDNRSSLLPSEPCLSTASLLECGVSLAYYHHLLISY